MPALETTSGERVDVTPPGAEETNARFRAAMTSDGPDDQAPPKRAADSVAADGKAKRGPGRPRKEDKSRAVPATVTALDDKTRAEGVKGVAQIVAGIAMMGGKAAKNDALQADAITIASRAGELADAAVQTAHADPVFAARLDKICAAGPYGALIMVAVGIGTQCVRNHKPDLKLPGTVHPSEILAAASPPAGAPAPVAA